MASARLQLTPSMHPRTMRAWGRHLLPRAVHDASAGTFFRIVWRRAAWRRFTSGGSATRKFEAHLVHARELNLARRT